MVLKYKDTKLARSFFYTYLFKKMFMSHKMLSSITLAVAIIVSGCEVKVKPIEGGKEIAKELERHKIKRVTDRDFIAAARVAGDSIVKVAQQELYTRVQAASQGEEITTALPYCQPENYPAVEALEKTYGAVARRTSSRLRNPQNKADGNTAAILAQYERGDLKAAQAMELTEEVLLYTSPIYITDESCLRCHGTPGQELLTADAAHIKQKYPSDEAIGYKMGELRGMWHITLDKKDFVAYLNAQPKKSRRRR